MKENDTIYKKTEICWKRVNNWEMMFYMYAEQLKAFENVANLAGKA
jgi:hypothetical protein